MDRQQFTVIRWRQPDRHLAALSRRDGNQYMTQTMKLSSKLIITDIDPWSRPSLRTSNWKNRRAREQSGVWDTPVNNNETLTDLVVARINTISLNNSPVVLAARAFQSKADHLQLDPDRQRHDHVSDLGSRRATRFLIPCTGTAPFDHHAWDHGGGAGQQIACPPGEIGDVVNAGTPNQIRFKNLGRIGVIWDSAGSSGAGVGGVAGCSSSAVSELRRKRHRIIDLSAVARSFWDQVAPNSKGKTRFALDQGRADFQRRSFSGTGVGQTGGAQTTTLSEPATCELDDPGTYSCKHGGHKV